MHFSSNTIKIFSSGLERADTTGPLHTVLWIGFYADIFWESKCNIEINVWPHFYKILFIVFEVPYQPQVKWMPRKS